ncbi:MAG: hypothetical protein ACR5K6_05930 [Wolbachia sp.]
MYHFYGKLDLSVEHWDDKKGSAGMTRKGGAGMAGEGATWMTTKGYFHNTLLVGSNHNFHAVVDLTQKKRERKLEMFFTKRMIPIKRISFHLGYKLCYPQME